MSGSDFELSGSSKGRHLEGVDKPEIDKDETRIVHLIRTETLETDIVRFSELGSEMKEILVRLALEVSNAEEQLNRSRSAVEAKKKELKTLHGIEATAVALERLVLDHQRQKETLEQSIAEQRTLLEKEKANREKEEREYQDSLRIRRERDEALYKQQWASERLKAQQKLEEESKRILQESLEKQQALERNCREREGKLKEKELEWVRLIQELEQFMVRLTRRAQAQAEVASEFPAKKESSAGQLSSEEPKSSISSLREILISQGKRIENLKS